MVRTSKKFQGDPATRERILKSAWTEIHQNGIIGLRLNSVAENAQVSVPLIYKYFYDRDGLLAEVLGDWYHEFVTRYQTAVDAWIDNAQQITLEEFAQLSPKPRGGAMKTDREFRLKVLATALENPELYKRVKLATMEAHSWGLTTMELSLIHSLVCLRISRCRSDRAIVPERKIAKQSHQRER